MSEGKLTILKEAFLKIDEQVKSALNVLDDVTVPFPSGASTFDSPMPVTHSYDALVTGFGGNEHMATALLERTIGTPGSNPMFIGSWNERQEARDFYADHPELFNVNPFPENAIDPEKFGA